MKPNRIYCFGCHTLFANKAAHMNHGLRDKHCSPEKRFWGRVNKVTPTGCWIFMGCLDGWGYGDLAVKGKHIQAHRYAWQITHGDPGELDVLHKCNNPPCCNPDHMYLGTDDDNSRDRLLAGAHYSKLKPADVLEIRRRFSEAGYRPRGLAKELAEKYGVDQRQIWNVKSGRQWKHL